MTLGLFRCKITSLQWGRLVLFYFTFKEGTDSMRSIISRIAEENFSRWVNHVHERNSKGAAGLFAPEFVFHPTKLGKMIETSEEAEEYYEDHFFPLLPVVKRIRHKVIPLSMNAYVDTGHYDLCLKNGEGEILRGKFDQGWKLQDGLWQKVLFNSAILPVHG